MPQIQDFNAAKRKVLTPRRLTLLASVAGLGVAVLLAGPGGYQAMRAHAWTSSADAAETVQQPAAGFADLVAKVKPAVISVRVKFERTADLSQDDNNGMQQFQQGAPFQRFFRQFGFGDMPNGRQRHFAITGEGSGFFISPDGYAVTNNHVVGHANTVQITTDDGTKYTAKVVGTDPGSDLALIKVDGKKDFTYVKFADQEPRIGDWVVAVGNPFGLGGTVTAGIVSARGREISTSPYDDYIQIDAPINKGNSGGPTFDMNGNVIGVNTAIYSPSGGSVGIGFDIPASTVKTVVAQLKDKGSVTRGWMGVRVQPVSQGIADSLGLKKAEGALVDEPQPNSPAAKAGIEAGDVITAINGTAVKDSRDLARKVAAMTPGTSVKFSVLRKGEAKTIELTLGTLPNQQQANAESGQSRQESADKVPHLGLTLAPAKDVAGAGDKGVIVMGVEPDGPAAEHGFQTGDVILDVGGKAVTTVPDLRRALTDAKTGGKHDVLMRVKTADGTRFIAMPLGDA
jgi:serine protease Do